MKIDKKKLLKTTAFVIPAVLIGIAGARITHADTTTKTGQMPLSGIHRFINGEHKGKGEGMFHNKAAKDAVTNNDYGAWKTALAKYPDQTKLTQDLFNKIVQVQSLTKEIRTALGDPKSSAPPVI